MNDHAAVLSLEPERLEALSASAGAEGPGPAMEGAHQIARRTGAPGHDLLVVLGSGAADALAAWGEPAASLRLSDLPGVMVPVAPGHEDRLDSYAVARGRKAAPRRMGESGASSWLADGPTSTRGTGPDPWSPCPVSRPLPAYAGRLVKRRRCLRSWQSARS